MSARTSNGNLERTGIHVQPILPSLYGLSNVDDHIARILAGEVQQPTIHKLGKMSFAARSRAMKARIILSRTRHIRNEIAFITQFVCDGTLGNEGPLVEGFNQMNLAIQGILPEVQSVESSHSAEDSAPGSQQSNRIAPRMQIPKKWKPHTRINFNLDGVSVC